MKLLPFLITNLLATKEPRKPNVIILLIDDVGVGDLSVNSKNGKIITPNLDKLAKGGVRYFDGHSGSSRCAPSRYNLMNGRYNFKDKHSSIATMRVGTPHLGSMFKKNGYKTAMIG